MTKYIIGIMTALIFNGCIVGDVVALPFRVTGAVLNVVTPDAVGDSVAGVGDALDSSIPF
jgi:hypothetical protein